MEGEDLTETEGHLKCFRNSQQIQEGVKIFRCMIYFSRAQALHDYCRFSHDVTKIQTTKLSILPGFDFHDVLEQLKTNFDTNFHFKGVLGFEFLTFYVTRHLHDGQKSGCHVD